MNKKDLISKVAETLRRNNIKKPISMPKQIFHISDDEGNKKDFVVRKTEKSVLYNIEDVTAVIEATLSVIEDAIKKGEDVRLYGFGTFAIKERASRTARHPSTGELVEVDSRYVPKFTYGNNLRMAAMIYGKSLDEQPQSMQSYYDEDEGLGG